MHCLTQLIEFKNSSSTGIEVGFISQYNAKMFSCDKLLKVAREKLRVTYRTWLPLLFIGLTKRVYLKDAIHWRDKPVEDSVVQI